MTLYYCALCHHFVDDIKWGSDIKRKQLWEAEWLPSVHSKDQSDSSKFLVLRNILDLISNKLLGVPGRLKCNAVYAHDSLAFSSFTYRRADANTARVTLTPHLVVLLTTSNNVAPTQPAINFFFPRRWVVTFPPVRSISCLIYTLQFPIRHGGSKYS